MDGTQARLAEYCVASDFACLTPNTVHRYERHLLDSLGCALGALDAEPAAIARRLAAAVRGSPGARIFRQAEPTSLEMAAFANGVLIRYLDFNDRLISGHPSDGLGALLAIAEAHELSGRELVGGLHVLYEVFGHLKPGLIRDRGWDQGTFLAVAVACGVGKLLGFSRQEMAETIAIAISDNVATRQARAGELSTWKGCATPNAARKGLFAALLAGEGMRGPTRPFEGTHGLFEQVTGPFALDLPAPGESSMIESADLKYFPTEGQAQGPALAAMELRQAVPVDEIEAIEVEVYQFAWAEIARDPEKWEPTSRETADHSLPYILATVLKHGTITPAHFEPEHLADPWVRALMPRVSVRPNDEFTRRWPAELPCRVTVRTRAGRSHAVEVAQPRGHHTNPMSDDEVLQKFEALAAPVLSPEQRRASVDFAGTLPEQPRAAALLDLLGEPAPARR
jgi:2-methylcitrate dehydratase